MNPEFQQSFPKTSEWIHLNNAGICLPPAPVLDVAHNWLERFRIEGAHCTPDATVLVEKSRASVASVIGCKTKELGFFQSTSGAVSQVAFGMDLKSGDEIITWDQEYPSNSLPWRVAAERSGAKLVVVPSEADMSTPAEKLLAAVTSRTKVIAVSWVQYQTGSITDLKALTEVARKKNIWTVVDVIQGLGQIPFNFADSGVDVVCGGSHKWMMSLLGVGLLAIREERIKELKPLMIGTETFQHNTNLAEQYRFEKTDATKFEPGSKQFLEIAAIGAAAEFLQRTGIEVIQKEIERKAELLRQGLREIGCTLHTPGKNPRGSIVNFSRGDLAERLRMEEILKEHKISYSQRGPGIRFSPHVYTSDHDIARVLSLLK